jgi:hypothetical protein
MLMLRAHAEQLWLSREVIPVIRQIETSDHLPEEQMPAAVAYLEVIWIESMSRARETETSRLRLEELHESHRALGLKASRYHSIVRVLREAVARRVAPLIAAPAETGAAGRPVLRDLIR